MKHSPDYHNLAKLTVIQQLRSYGIKIKHWNSKRRSEPGKGALQNGKVFGAPIFSLPQQCIPEYGNIPMFLVEVCKYLENHSQTEGLFRKSGSVVRQKLLKSKLDRGENSLSDAPPCDVAGILKQFFRELPEPILPADLQDALYKAQNLGSEEERISATMLVSCLIPENTLLILRYFFNFLHAVSMRSDANKMDSSNLAVIFAPNLLQSDDSEKISASTEKKLRVQAAIVKTLIDQAADIGCVPDFLLEKIPSMLGVDVSADTPGSRESDLNVSEERKKSRRKSVGDFVNGALNKLKTNRTPSSTPQSDRTVLSSMVTPLILTPSTKRKLPLDSVQGISNKKRKSIKQNLTFELLPSSLFGGSTPSSVKTERSPCVYIETSDSSFSPSAKHLTSSANLRRSKRYETRKVQRVESGKTGCFSPKISKKEMVRRSLRLRFSLGKSNKDVNSSIRCQNIGWRLANSQELPVPEKVSEFSSQVKSTCVSAGSKKISKSEENLLTPQKSDELSHRMSWTGPLPLSEKCDEGTPVAGYLYAGSSYSEPFLVAGKPPSMPKKLMSLQAGYQEDENQAENSLCEEENGEAQNTVQRITNAFTQSGSDLHAVVACAKSPEEVDSIPIAEAKKETGIQDSSFNCDNNGGVHDSISKQAFSSQGKYVFENEAGATVLPDNGLDSVLHVIPPQILRIEEEDRSADIPEASHHKQECDVEVLKFQIGNLSESPSPLSREVDDMSAVSEPVLLNMVSIPISDKEASSQSSQSSVPLVIKTRRACRVSDHIQHFNKLCLSDRSAVQNLKSPMKFQRTPVRQSVRRINSLSGTKREVENAQSTSLPMVKSVSCDEFPSSALHSSNVNRASLSRKSKETSVGSEHLATCSLLGSSSRIPRQNSAKSPHSSGGPSVPFKSVLEDLTNQNVPRTTVSKCESSANTPNNARHVLSFKEPNRYRGSPRNPISRVKLMPATKPLEL